MITLNKANQEAVAKKITAIITDLEKQISKNNTKMEQIDEEFRQKALAKKASLLEETTSLTEEVKYWKTTATTRYGMTLSDFMEDATTTEDVPASEPEDKKEPDLFSEIPEETVVEETPEQEEPEQEEKTTDLSDIPVFEEELEEEDDDDEEEEEEEEEEEVDGSSEEDFDSDSDWEDDFPDDWKD